MQRLQRFLTACVGRPVLVPIIGNEFCERWCFYSVRAVLVLYLTGRLNVLDDDAVSLYSFFMAACYFAPLLGGYVADRFLGKYRTIVLFNVFYIVGLALLVVGAFQDSRGPSFAGLLFMALGTGGIKPNISPLGADQLVGASEEQRMRFFFLFYASINLGSTLSYIVTPIIRANYGFQWAFVLSLIVLSVSIVVFLAGGRYYVKVPPTGRSVYAKFVAVFSASCCRKGARSCCRLGKIASTEATPLIDGATTAAEPMPPAAASHDSLAASGGTSLKPAGEPAIAADGSPLPAPTTGMECLDSAFAAVPAADVLGVAAVLRILPAFACLPVFWALFDTQGSVFVLQRKAMQTICLGGGDRACMTPEQLGVLNPLFVLALVPLMTFVVERLQRRAAARYGTIGAPASAAAIDSSRSSSAQHAAPAQRPRAWYEPTALRRMCCGMFITAAAFVAAALVQKRIDDSPAGSVNVLLQVPPILLITVAEILVSATGLEWAYSVSPPSMRSSVMAAFQAMTAIGNLLTGTLYAALSKTLSSLQILLLLTGLMVTAAVAFTIIAIRFKRLVFDEGQGQVHQEGASAAGSGSGSGSGSSGDADGKGGLASLAEGNPAIGPSRFQLHPAAPYASASSTSASSATETELAPARALPPPSGVATRETSEIDAGAVARALGHSDDSAVGLRV